MLLYTKGNLLFAEENKKPELVEKILACLKNQHAETKLLSQYAENQL